MNLQPAVLYIKAACAESTRRKSEARLNKMRRNAVSIYGSEAACSEALKDEKNAKRAHS